MANPLLKALLGGTLTGALAGGILGAKYKRKLDKIMADDAALQSLAAVGDEATLRLISELQPPEFSGKSGDGFRVVGLVVKKTKQGRVKP